MIRQQNFTKKAHTARMLATFHSGRNYAADKAEAQRVLKEALEAGVDGREEFTPPVPTEEEAVAFITGKPVRAIPGEEIEISGHKVRVGASFISEAQAKWIVDLLETREIPGAESTFVRLEQGLAKRAGSEFITANKNAPRKPVAPVAKPDYAGQPSFSNAPKTDDVPAGRYALRTEDDVVKFYRLDKPTEGKWAGYTFLKAQGSDDLYPIRNRAEKERIIAEISKDVLAAEQLYGQELGKCSRCGRTLTDETSRDYGIGPDCRAK